MPPSKQDNYDLEIQQPLKEHDSMDNSQQKPLMTENSKQHIASPSNMKSITACSLYSFCSVSMVLVNKSLASSYGSLYEGSLNNFLVVIQAVVAVICVEFCRRVGWVDYPPLSWNVVKSWAPVNIFFCLMLFTGMASLQNNSVPMVTVFKNVTNILTTAGDYFFFGSRPEGLVYVAFAVMLGGAIAAAGNDAEVTMVGIFWMAMNCFSTSAYVLYMKHATQSIKLSKFGMVYVNNILCVVFMLPAAYALGEVGTFLNTKSLHTMDYGVKNFFAGFVGFFLNFASLNCVQITGPTTYAIIGSVNKVPVAIIGWVMFNSVITPQTWFFIAISMCGGFLYSFAKIRSSRQKALSK